MNEKIHDTIKCSHTMRHFQNNEYDQIRLTMQKGQLIEQADNDQIEAQNIHRGRLSRKTLTFPTFMWGGIFPIRRFGGQLFDFFVFAFANNFAGAVICLLRVVLLRMFILGPRVP